jgi:hypothetical protein
MRREDIVAPAVDADGHPGRYTVSDVITEQNILIKG